MEYTCQHCGANLDEGDIFEHFFNEYKDYTKAIISAGYYGWSETNKKHFNRSLIIQPDDSEQYTICPDCEVIDPFPVKSNVNK
jgi:hypothetical protein